MHACNTEDIFGVIGIEGLTGNALKDRTEEHISIVAVIPLRSRFEGQIPRPIKCDELCRRRELFRVSIILRAKDVACASGMCQQLLDRYLLRQRSVWVIRQIRSEEHTSELQSLRH